MEVMQLVQTLPVEANDFLVVATEREQALDAEASALVDEYRETLAGRTASIDARIGEFAPGADVPANYMQILDDLYGQWDAEYAVHCGEWYGPSGRYGDFLGALRGYLLDDWVSETKRLTDLKNETQAFLGGVDASGYFFTGEHEAAIRYIDTVLSFLTWREQAAKRGTP
jgi:hypothetical protein